MKSCLDFAARRRIPGGALAVVGTLCAVTATGELARYLQHLDSASRLRPVFFRQVPTPAGPVEIRRWPKETRPDLTARIASAPTDAGLFPLRAREAELQLDFSAAEADWKKAAELSRDKAAANLELADFYHRRLRAPEELDALLAAGAVSSALELPAVAQLQWKAFERALSLAEAQALGDDAAVRVYRAWLARYPGEQAAYSRYLDFSIARRGSAAIGELTGLWTKQFPDDEVFPVRARAALARARGSSQDALAVYERSYRPNWPPALVSGYFDLLEKTGLTRKFVEQTRRAIAANPTDLGPASRLYHYHQQLGNPAAAQRALLDFSARKQARQIAWTAGELETVAVLLEGAGAHDGAVRHYYALYSLPGAPADAREKALAGIADILLTAPEQPIRFGSGDLSMYSDVATMDRSPGFLNGILSLLLNSSGIESRFDAQQQAAAPYWHRARAAELARLFETRFPGSKQRPRLREKLISAYVTYADSDGVIRAGQTYLNDFASDPGRTRVALWMAEAYARKGQTRQEFAIYEAQLKELAAKAGGVPLGAATPQPPAAPQQNEAAKGPAPGNARSPEYARVLDRYIARLVSLKRTKEALAIFRAELDRNPNDPGLYERLAGFLEQNKLADQIEAVYKAAIARFQDTSWRDKLARWYLRRKQVTEFAQLSQEVIRIFSGSDLEEYFRNAVQSNLDAVLYRQLNLFAHERFPSDTVFVRNLLAAYSTQGTADPVAWDRLIRANWFHADDLRARFFEYLSRTGRLDRELAAIRTANPGTAAGRWSELATANPAAALTLAEGESWRSHEEQAAPILRALHAEAPAEPALARRASSVHRSLGAVDARNAAAAIEIETDLVTAGPRDSQALARIGEILAEQEQIGKAKPYWDRIARIEPGNPAGYLESATVFWDYFQFDDALRQIQAARSKLGNPALFAYEAGAIHESRRDFASAIGEYAAGAAGVEGESQARSRLIALAGRPSLRQAIDNAVVRKSPGANALPLRLALLEAQNRRADLERTLAAEVSSRAEFEGLEQVKVAAQRLGFDGVQRSALEREISLSGDPVDRTRLRLELARFLEGRQDTAGAAAAMEGVYRDNPKILGVVRAVADYHWRNKNANRTIEILAAAAGAAYPALRRDLTLEASRKAAESGQQAKARQLLAPLIAEEPLNAEYLAAMADTFAREGDDQNLRAFYLAKLAEVKASDLPAGAKQERSAALRRGLIPALTRLKDFGGATDQYIEIINRYPDDDSLVREAAGYARGHSREQQLLDYYSKTASASPKDYRWPLVQARLAAAFEDFSSAIEAYGRALAIRPDQVDFYIARAALEQRMMRFDEAARTYAKLYDLSYRNPAWMVKSAEMRARQGQPAAAVAAIRQALIDGRPERAENFTEAARQTEREGILAEARAFAEKALTLSPDADTWLVYAQVMARCHQAEAAFQKLVSVPDARPAVQKLGDAIRVYSTPEEKAAFAAYLDKARARASKDDILGGFIPVAEAANLFDLEARLRYQAAAAEPGSPESESQISRAAEQLERRLKFDDAGRMFESYAKLQQQPERQDQFLVRASESYRAGGQAAAELRVLTAVHGHVPSHFTAARYHELLARGDGRRLVAAAAGEDGAANYAVQSGNATLAMDAVQARGASLGPVWQRAYKALTGFHYGRTGPDIRDAFTAALGPLTAGEQIGHQPDRAQQLAGGAWFYYAGRYGEFLGLAGQGTPDDYLAAPLEQTPESAEAYFQAAEYYRSSKNGAAALAEYDHTLQLDPSRGDALDRRALIYWDQGRRSEATAEWRNAIAAFAKQQDQRVPESFWDNLKTTLEHAGERKLLAAVKPDADRLLRTYIRRNGSYRIEPLLEGVVAAAGDERAGVEWIVDLSRAAANRGSFLEQAINASWLSKRAREPLLRERMAGAEAELAAANGEARAPAESSLRNWQVQWIVYLLDTRRNAEAQAAFDRVKDKLGADQRFPLEIRVAARGNTLERVLEQYRTSPDREPSADHVRAAALDLRRGGDDASARRGLEYLYRRSLERGDLSAANFLGLAEIRLGSGDLAAAQALLRRMALVSGEPFENLTPAAELLARAGHPQEAVEFYAARVNSTPWDDSARLALAKSRADSAALEKLARSSGAAYAVRASAAQLARGTGFGGAELDLLASGSAPGQAAAEKPFSYFARVAAARAPALTPAVRIRLLRSAVEIDPSPAEPRVDLLRAALEARQPALAFASVGTVLRDNGEPFVIPLADEILEGRSFEDGSASGERFLAGLELKPAHRAGLARGLADSLRSLGRPGFALNFYEIAQALDPGPAVAQTIASIRADRQGRLANEARAPKISSSVEQSGLVRPRLPPGRLPRTTGGAQ